MYTFRIFFYLIAASLVAVSADLGKERKKNPLMLYRNYLGLNSIMRSAGEVETCNPEETTCKDDKLTFCPFGSGTVTVPCSSLFDDKVGYCDCEGIQCTRNRSVCMQPNNEKCTRVGKMPDSSNCKKFTYCNGQTKKIYSCLEGLVYDPKTQSCKAETPCRTLTCNPKKILEYIPFPQAPNYYLFCYFGISEVRECSQSGYSMQDNKCQFQCTEPGLFKDPKPENCKKGMWHGCVLSKNKLLVRHTNYCGRDGEKQLYFDENIGICQPNDICSTADPTITPSPGTTS